MNEPIFSSLTGKATGFLADFDWMGGRGTYCPAGTYDGVNYYMTATANPPASNYMWRSNGYWYVAYTDQPGALYAAPDATVQSNSSTPPLSGWSNGGVLVSANC
jgi:hypothetical protein